MRATVTNLERRKGPRDWIVHSKQSSRLTPVGKLLVPLSVCFSLIAWTDGGVLILFAAATWTLLILGFLSARWRLRGIELRPPLLDHAFVGRSQTAELELRRHSTRTIARDILIYANEARAESPAAHLAELNCRQGTEKLTIALRFVKRGRKRMLPITLCSSFPFGLITCRLDYELPVHLLVLPCPGRLGPLSTAPQPREEPIAERTARHLSQDEAYGVREWREGEGLRLVHWKHSARRGRLILRDLRSQRRSPLHIVLCARLPRGARRASFERAIRLTATLIQHNLLQGRRLHLSLCGEKKESLTGSHREALFPLLARLALVQSEKGPIDPHIPIAAPGEELLIVLAGGGAPGLRTLAPGRAARVLDVDAPDADLMLLPEVTSPEVAPPELAQQKRSAPKLPQPKAELGAGA